jgi:hypothetical protein
VFASRFNKHRDRGPGIEGPLRDFDLLRELHGHGFRPLLNDFRRKKGRLSSISCPIAGG